MLWLKRLPNVKLCRLQGSWMPSKLRLKRLPNVKPCRLLASWMPSKLWLNSKPNVKLCRLLGSWMPSKLWLNALPTVKLCRMLSTWMPWLSSWPGYHVDDIVCFRAATSTSSTVFSSSRCSQSIATQPVPSVPTLNLWRTAFQLVAIARGTGAPSIPAFGSSEP